MSSAADALLQAGIDRKTASSCRMSADPIANARLFGWLLRLLVPVAAAPLGRCRHKTKNDAASLEVVEQNNKTTRTTNNNDLTVVAGGRAAAAVYVLLCCWVVVKPGGDQAAAAGGGGGTQQDRRSSSSR